MIYTKTKLSVLIFSSVVLFMVYLPLFSFFKYINRISLGSGVFFGWLVGYFFKILFSLGLTFSLPAFATPEHS